MFQNRRERDKYNETGLKEGGEIKISTTVLSIRDARSFALYLPSLISGGNLPFRIRSRIAILPMDNTDKIASSGPTNSTEVHSKVQMAGANIHPQLAQHFAFLSPPTVSIHLVWRLKLAVKLF